MFNQSLKYISFLFIFISILTHIPVFPQDVNEKVIASIGDNYLLESEFENRLNFSPKEGIQDKNNSDGIKKELLYTIIAEKLWSNYAQEIGFENNISIITAKNVIEKMLVRDELYKREIKDKILFNDDEVEKAEFKFSRILKTTIYSSVDKNKLIELQKLFSANKNLESISSSIDPNQIIVKNIEITFGDLPEGIENLLYNLEPNSASALIQMDSIWNIFYINEIIDNKSINAKNKNDVTKKIYKVLKVRKEETYYNRFYADFFKDITVDADGKLFNIISENLSTVFNKKYQNGIFEKDKNGNTLITFDTNDLNMILDTLGTNLIKEPFLLFSQNPIDVETFLREIRFLSFNVTSPQIDIIKLKLNEEIKNFIKYELLARKGFELNLQYDSNVKKWLKVWIDSYLYQGIRNTILNIENTILTENLKIEDIINKNSSNESLDRYKIFVDKTIELSDRYNINIDWELFAKINIGNINLFVFRNIGFGGRISGVPTSEPFIDWYLEKQKISSQNL
ncbi:MAG: hypothetical protein IPH62_09760 [Ignavibacteriae bacterium]|nr:hypothetical protein [Ignavibacteriota bacterium]